MCRRLEGQLTASDRDDLRLHLTAFVVARVRAQSMCRAAATILTQEQEHVGEVLFHLLRRGGLHARQIRVGFLNAPELLLIGDIIEQNEIRQVARRLVRQVM
jgi:hypothetical protein